MKNYYALLGVDRKATKEDIKKTYRKLAIRYHPDKSSDPEAPTKFIAITEAYDILSNKKKRAQYDLFVWESLKKKQQSANSFKTVVPPRESSRTRRNKAQAKRSTKYHRATSKGQKSWLLMKEGFYVVARYYVHILGATLLLFLMRALSTELRPALESGLVSGLFMVVLILAVVYGLFKLGQLSLSDGKKDVEALSVLYKITQSQAKTSILSALTIVLLAYILFLKIYF